MNEDIALIIDGSNISEVAKFISSDTNDVYISLNPNNDITNGGIIGATSNSIYLGLKTNNSINKIINIDDNNISINKDIISKNITTSNIYCSNIYTNNLNISGWNDITNEYNGIIVQNQYILNLSLITDQTVSTSNQKINFKSNINDINYNDNNNYFTPPANGLYSINLYIKSDNTNVVYWINKSNDITNLYNNAFGIQTNNSISSIILNLSKSDTIYFFISTTITTIISSSKSYATIIKL